MQTPNVLLWNNTQALKQKKIKMLVRLKMYIFHTKTDEVGWKKQHIQLLQENYFSAMSGETQ